MSPFDAIVIGAGAAGMMCAARAGQRCRRVLIIDHYPKLGEKIRISGGGRCNFTNLHTTPANFLSQNPHFCRSALARYTPRDFIKLVDSHRIAWHEKTLGQLFCDDSANQIIAMLKVECDRAGVTWKRPVKVGEVRRADQVFSVATEAGTFLAPRLVVATGGLAVSKIGATPFGYQLAQQFGLAVVPPKPALVPLSFDPESLARYGDLSGLSLDSEVSCGEGRFREALLLTHRGLSGPSILQVSSYWQSGPAKEPIHVDLLPGENAAAWLEGHKGSKQLLSNLLAERLPRRFAQSFTAAHGIDLPLNNFSRQGLADAARLLADWQVKPSGTLGYNKAEVTLGGVDTKGLSSKTLEATTVPGLHFIGEVVDVTGHLGGFNFQWAWASAVACAEAL